MKKSGLFRGLFEGTGPPTQESLRRLHDLQADCERRKNPNSFYLTFSLSDKHTISWSHNIFNHLGVSDVTTEQYFARIHPVWFPLHVGYATAAYGASFKLPRLYYDEHAIYTTNIPIKRNDGTYHWYNQVSTPVIFDNAGRLAGHLNEYHRLCAFDDLIPTKPNFAVNGEFQKEFEQEFMRAGNAQLTSGLVTMLTPTNYRILQTYRSLAIFNGKEWVPPSKKAVREATGLSVPAINKANVRIIQTVRGKFPAGVTRDVAGFSAFLNELCGRP